MSGIVEYVKMAVQNIRANRGRSILTMLGIIIGISSVIAIVGIGQGTKKTMNDMLDNLGILNKAYVTTSMDASDEGIYITQDDMDAVQKLEGVEGICVSSISETGETSTGKGVFNISLVGEGPDAEPFNTYDIKYGNYFTASDVEEAKNVCVINDADAKKLFGTTDVVGMTIDVTCLGVSQVFQIVAVTTPKQDNPFYGESSGDDAAIKIPYTAMEVFVGEMNEFGTINILCGDSYKGSDVAKRAVKVLEKSHQCSGEEYFIAETSEQDSQDLNQMMNMMTLFVSFVAAISLFVGGIGVMNIMLVSVTERTREIGIRKSLGAKTSSIMTQFLAEAAILTGIGGIVGIILGVIASYLGAMAMSAQMVIDVKPEISINVVLGAVIFSAVVGMFFGIYPAKKAAKLRPIEALRTN